MSKTEAFLRVCALSIDYHAASGDTVHAVRNVDFAIGPGESLGVLGESGSGKSSLALALMRLLPGNAQVLSGSVTYQGRSLANFSPKQLREMRGSEVSLISQEPALALNPVLPLGRQLADVLLAHSNLGSDEVSLRCNRILGEVGFTDSERFMRAYPHELSGGQRQRVAIAQALICGPKLLIADEPLSALDLATQAEILDLLQRLKRELGLAMLFITHNAGVLSALADNILVMRNGEVAARGTMDKLQNSSDAYVQSVLFPEKNLIAAPHNASGQDESCQSLLEVRNLSKKFVQQRMWSRKRFVVQSLESVNLELREGSTVAVLGRSGSGKSTLARCIAGFEAADTGEILLEGKREFLRRQVQMIFQDAATSLNPGFTARQIVVEPMEIARWKTDAERASRVLELMEEVGLDPAWASRTAAEFSGGQRQRLALARALAAEPKLLIMDEALSGLDLPLQAQMLRLLMGLQKRHGLTYLYISHDLSFISLFAQEVVVMEAGRIVDHTIPARLGEGVSSATRELVEASERLHAPGVEVTV
ncbi:MAG TPA: ABC transporter ATP-binding protein [Candidatus Angelobacter sp.]